MAQPFFRIFTDAGDFERKLKRMSKEAFPKAVAATLTTLGRAAHNRSIRNIKQKMIVRNQYTERSMKFYKASPLKSFDRMNAVTGSISPYLPIQDTGGTVRGKGGRVPIPSNALRGPDRRKVIPARFRMRRLGRLGAPGSKFFVTGGSGREAIYYRKNKTTAVRLRTLKRSYRVPARRWHTDAVRAFSSRSLFEAAFNREARKALGTIK